MDVKTEEKKEKEDSVAAEEVEGLLSPAEEEQLRALREVSRRVQLLPPGLPSVCFYTFINAHQGYVVAQESLRFLPPCVMFT